LLSGIDIGKQLANAINKIVGDLDFNLFATALDNSFRTLANSLTDVFTNLGRQADKLNGIVTDFDQSFQLKAPTNQKDLFKEFGSSFIVNFQNQSKAIADQLDSVLNNTDLRKRLEGFVTTLSGIRGGPAIDDETPQGRRSLQETFVQALDEADTKDIGRQFFAVIQQLADESNKSVSEVFKAIANGANQSTESIVNELRNQGGVIGEFEQAIRQTIDLSNKRIEIENKLKSSIRALSVELFNFDEVINQSIDSIQERRDEQESFLTKRSPLNQLITSAGRASSQAARSTFSNQPQFIQELLDAVKSLAAAQNTNAAGNNQNTVRSGTDVQNTVLDKQAELGLRLVELSRRVGNAAQATDLLRDAFNTLENNIQAAGQAVTQFTVRDLADSIAALKDFQQGGLENVNDEQFGQVQKLLGAIGELNIGGVSGNRVLEDINTELGSNFAAAIKTVFEGGTFQDNLAATKTELENLRQQQEAAAAAEKLLRDQQVQLLQAQAQLIPIEQAFYKEQLAKLDSINVTLEPLQRIDNLLQSSLKLPIPVSEIKGVDKLTKEQRESRQQIIDNNNKLLDQLRNNNNTSSSKGQFVSPTQTQTPNRLNPSTRDPFDPNLYPGGRLPTSLRPNALPPQTPSPDRNPLDPSMYPGGRLPSYLRPNAPAQPMREQRPRDLFDPNNYPGGRLPSYMRPNDVSPIKPIDDVFNPFKDKLTTTTDQFEKLNSSLKSYNESMMKLIQQVNGVGTNGTGPTSTLEIAPIQVNVALAAPDILNLAGESLYRAVMAKIAPAIAQSFGVISPEAQNQFESNVPKF
jgi:hypothetical protein